MIRTASYAPHLGSALAAGFMLVAALAYNLGANSSEAEARAVAAPADLDSRQLASSWPGVIRVEAANRIGAAPEPSVVETSVLTSEPVEPTLLTPPLTSGRPQLAVIIDDVGLDVAAARRLIALDAPVTLSILPYADAASALAREILARTPWPNFRARPRWPRASAGRFRVFRALWDSTIIWAAV